MFFFFSPLVSSYNFSNYSVNVEFERTGMHHIYRSMTVSFLRSETYIQISIPRERGGLLAPMSLSDISADGRKVNDSDDKSIRVYRSSDDPNPALFAVDYRMSTPFVEGVLNISILSLEQSNSFPECTFNVTFHTSIENMNFSVQSNPSDSCTLSVSGRTVSGVCLPKRSLKSVFVSAPLPRFLFSAPPAEIALLVICVIAFVGQCCGLAYFGSLFSKGLRSAKQSTRQLPLAVTKLVYGKTRGRQALLYLAGQGKVSLLDEPDNVSVSSIVLPEGDNPPYEMMHRSLVREAGDSATIDAARVNAGLADVEEALDKEALYAIRQRGWLFQPTGWMVLWIMLSVMLVMGFPYFIVLTFNAPSYLLPVFLMIVTGFLALIVIFVGSGEGASRWIAIQYWYFFVVALGIGNGGAAFGIFWGVACGWDQITMVVESLAMAAAIVWVVVLADEWTPKGVTKAGRFLKYLESLERELPVDNDREFFTKLSYLLFSRIEQSGWDWKQIERWWRWQVYAQKKLEVWRRSSLL
jgi:hypothetical protein